MNSLKDSNILDREIIAKEIDLFGGKPTFLIDSIGEGLWTEIIVTLGNDYSYSHNVSQDGARGFTEKIKEEIFPNINIK